MRTLVYFASGPLKREYQNLDFDRIYLIDNCFNNKIIKEGKITCIGMDCLKSIEYLKKEKVKIDYFVSLNEGLYEGGGSYALNSDFFLGYAMPLFKENYIHIMNQNYYHNYYKVGMDLPYELEEINETETDYISPFTFSENKYHKGHAKVYKMTSNKNSIKIKIKSKVKLCIKHDSIWNHYQKLDLLGLSIKIQGQGNYFDHMPKTINLNNNSIEKILDYCSANRINKLGLTPWAYGNYIPFIKLLENFEGDYPNEITLFHLNKNDYKAIKEYANI